MVGCSSASNAGRKIVIVRGKAKHYHIFKPGMRSRRPCVPGFLKLLWFACWSESASRALITSGMIWCDIGHVRLVEQVLQLSPAFNYFI